MRIAPLAIGTFLGTSMVAAAQQAADRSPCAAALAPMLTLAAAEERFGSCNRDVRAARVALDAAAADRVVAGQRPNPNLGLGVSNVNPHAGIGPGPLRDKAVDSSIRLDQLIERGGKPQLRERQAEANVAAARADLAEALRAQRLAMRQAFFDAAAAQERVRLQTEFLKLSRESLAATEERLKAGDVAKVDVNRIRLDALRAANDLRQAEIDFERARAELAKAIGAEGAAARVMLAVAWPESEAETREAQGDRPDVVAARFRIEAAEAARDLAKSLSTRDVTIGLQADRWPVIDTNTLGTGVSYSLNVSIPLHVRHAYEGEAKRALADLDAAREQSARAEALSDAEKRLAKADWNNARERRARVESDVLPAAHEVANASEFAYTRGATGVLDLLDARRSLKAVEIDATQARADAAKAWARLQAAYDTYREEPR